MKLIFVTALIALLVVASYGQSTSEDSKSSIGGPKRYRVSGILQMFNYDGLRVGIVTLYNFLKNGGSIGELLRKADKFFTNAEIKGKISIELPDGQTKTIFNRDGYSPFSFAEPIYFSVEYEGKKASEFKINCDMVDKDTVSAYDTVCSGSETYKAQSSLFGAKSLNDQTLFKEQLGNITKSVGKANDDVIDLVMKVIHMMGYEKLKNTEGAQDMRQVIETLINLAQELQGFSIETLEQILKAVGDISGIFLINLNVEKIKKDGGTWKRIEDSWNVIDTYEGLNELYGQLYLMPQANILNIADMAEGLGLTIPYGLKNLVKDLELPFVNGPAFPLFDLSREEEKKNGFEIQSKRNRFNAYLQSKEDKRYIVFANLWETDGDSAFSFDDCFVKGNAMGLETIDFTQGSEFRMSQCDNDDIHTTLYREKDIVIDDEKDLVEYELRGTFSIYCTSDAGKWYEPYGEFLISVGDRPINQKFLIWKIAEEDYITTRNGHSYVQPFAVRFQESESFMNSPNDITFFGKVTESDKGDNDPIGSYEGHKVDSQILSELRSFRFPGEDNNAVTIRMQLKPLTVPPPVELIDYVLTGNFDFWNEVDAGKWYEAYGDFRIDIGNREENLNYQVWYRSRGDYVELRNYDHYSLDFTHEFQELSNFMDAGQTSSQIVLHGYVKESDRTSADDWIGDMEGATYNPSDLLQENTRNFPADQAGTTIKLKIQKSEMSTRSSDTKSKKEDSTDSSDSKRNEEL